MGIELRNYQREAVNKIFEEWGSGHSRTLLVQATGTGKTVVFAEVVRRVAEEGGRSLVLAHRGELLEQAADKIGRATGLTCAVEKAESTSVGSWERVTVGSVQTLMRDSRLKRLAPDRFSCIVVDEAHHSLADGYVKVLDHFSGAKVLGVTATADRADRRDLGEVFDSIAYEYGMARAVKDGWLCPIEAEMVPLTLDVSGVSVTHGDYQAGQLGDALEPYLKGIADELATRCQDRRTVVFLPLVRTAKAFAAMLRERGMSACEVDGQSEDRAEVLTDFAAGKYKVLCNSMLLTEGWDCPAVDCIVVLRPTKSRGLYCQMVGRGTRLSPETGKDRLLLLDFLWMTGRHDLCRPAALFASSDEVAQRMTEMVQEAAGPIDLMEAEPMAETDVAAQREAALAAELERMRHRKAKLVDPLQYAVSVCDLNLQTYEPTFAWQAKEASSRQREQLERFGVNPDGMDAGMASLMLDRLHERIDAHMATPKQVRMLERKGFRHPGLWTFDQASAMMTRLAQNRWQVPWGIDPATYEPGGEE
ncbi:DEAD/DEAH box helicase [Olsenella uli]|uniref:DEAD/DEAH box helicase n=1 Tax=Olsenella uli TaxID=133926 RepID=UPI0028E3E969|nr:DEAD/DEAH box helicase [Olsenella uli]